MNTSSQYIPPAGAAPMTGLWLEESRFGDGFFDAGGNGMYYVRDRLGNVTAVADGDGNVRQRTGCYPYGMPWRPLGTESSNRVLFGGKEYHTADGLDEYDFGARRHYPRFPAFTTPDPHADNTPWLSPYVFCAANPVTYVDPSGMDQFKYNEDGYLIERIEDESMDKISIISNDNKEISSVELKYGTVEEIKHADGVVVKGEVTSVDALVIRDDENATKVFEMFASIPENKNEYAQLKMGNEGTGPNLVSTSHTQRYDVSMSFFLNGQYQFDYTIREHIHSHPSSNTVAGKNDKRFGVTYLNSTKQNIIFKIWTTTSGYVEYDPRN